MEKLQKKLLRSCARGHCTMYESKVKAIFLGTSYHVNNVSNILDNFKQIQIFDFRRYYGNVDLIYWVGIFPSLNIFQVIFHILRNSNVTIIMHWIGTDVLYYINPDKIHQIIFNNLLKLIFILKHQNTTRAQIFHLSVSPWLADELKSVNLISTIFPISTIDQMEKYDEFFFPKKYDVMSYVPLSRFDFYGGNIIIRLAKKLPDLNFLIIMSDVNKRQLPSFSLKNLTLKSKVAFSDMYKFYKMSKCFLRIPQHDGLSLSVLESLFYELECIWIHDFPYTKKVNRNNLNEIALLLQGIADDFVPNKKGHKYVIDNYSIDILKKRYKILFERADKTTKHIH